MSDDVFGGGVDLVEPTSRAPASSAAATSRSSLNSTSIVFCLPPGLRGMFDAHPAPALLEHPDDRPSQRRARQLAQADSAPHSLLTGVGGLLDRFERPGATTAQRQAVTTAQDRRRRRLAEAAEQNRRDVLRQRSAWNPHDDELQQKTRAPYRTIIVARLSYDTTVETLRRAAEEFGEVEDVVVVRTPRGEPRGYGFVQFAYERDMREAYERMDGRLIDGRAVVVDVERGRTVSTWLPRRLGGGRGSTRSGDRRASRLVRRGRDPVPTDHSAVHSRRGGGGGGGFRGARGQRRAYRGSGGSSGRYSQPMGAVRSGGYY